MVLNSETFKSFINTIDCYKKEIDLMTKSYGWVGIGDGNSIYLYMESKAFKEKSLALFGSNVKYADDTMIATHRTFLWRNKIGFIKTKDLTETVINRLEQMSTAYESLTNYFDESYVSFYITSDKIMLILNTPDTEATKKIVEDYYKTKIDNNVYETENLTIYIQ